MSIKHKTEIPAKERRFQSMLNYIEENKKIYLCNFWPFKKAEYERAKNILSEILGFERRNTSKRAQYLSQTT